MNQHRRIDSATRDLRDQIAESTLRDEEELFRELSDYLGLDEERWQEIAVSSRELIVNLRAGQGRPLIDQFLTEYGLSNDEGVQLMRLAEALSRTSDSCTADELIRDKIAGRNWLAHTGAGRSLPMRLSGHALNLTDKWLGWSGKPLPFPLRQIGQCGNALIRFGTRFAIRALSGQFVFAETLEKALSRARQYGRKGYLFSFDMLGEAARTKSDAEGYYAAYVRALDNVCTDARSADPRHNHGISVKLSALHPRYEFAQAEDVVPEIADLLVPLAVKARAANVQMTIDAEEAERLDISMDVLSSLISRPELKGWHGLGFVVQAYQRRAMPLLFWLSEQAERLGAPLFIRLVKGAYWDSEIKGAQEMGLDSYPVFTRKEMTDLSYLACAKKLLAHPDRFSPQFATHNAHSVTAIRALAGDDRDLEFQRLFGMGQQLHDTILAEPNIISRIYAPVGTQKDLLSYLIRRLLENGANSSFVNKLADPAVDASLLSRDPVNSLNRYNDIPNANIPQPRQYLRKTRESARGRDLSCPLDRRKFADGIAGARQVKFTAVPLIGGRRHDGTAENVRNPAVRSEVVGEVQAASAETAELAIQTADSAFASWSGRPAAERADILDRAAGLLEEQADIFHDLAIREAGKTWQDAIDEVREAVDFCRYYAAQVRSETFSNRHSLGVVVCISPWNFPLAIFLGQVVAALAAGNTAVAKPAEQTPLIAAQAVRLLHEAGIPAEVVNFVPGNGALVGESLVAHPKTAGICFTGSTATARRIAARMAETGRATAPLIAETGGINAMIVDSSALLEQTVDAVISSAFQSAGQRCSALRILCVQEDIADEMIRLLGGAMAALTVGDPASLATDIGPVIDATARDNIADHINHLEQSASKIGEAPATSLPDGTFIAPVAYELDKFADLQREIFGPVLHVVRFRASERMQVIEQINASGYGLTMGVQSRIDTICRDMAERAHVGNIYINRNQIGAIVGVQPFGGAGLSGTGPKAGGPLYLNRLSKPPANTAQPAVLPKFGKAGASKHGDIGELIARAKTAQKNWGRRMPAMNMPDLPDNVPDGDWRKLLDQQAQPISQFMAAETILPSPAGETNQYHLRGRGVVLSLISDAERAIPAWTRSILTGNAVVHICTSDHNLVDQGEFSIFGQLFENPDILQVASLPDPKDLRDILLNQPIDAVLLDQDDPEILEIGTILAQRKGAIIAILHPDDSWDRYVHEQTVTDNIAAAGGDVKLLNA
ncbi:L-proline dehydrogenase /delta-1-pyrroline-5-carboxylate dehydrogenase [Parasphingorhabdus marina DSM 22363]|uniref:Bifunctional protein PutA n=1 Tax=Parasphingorhabdus marina DSM 22363 TaxID=1123272 RepID=A0A1N6G3X6_9SPHN|nr:bifunctional proline dehydrogenase/L-glutamate gamma-semialdehyde dehydrogenase PutA [Parasphingorhabdus marina]SIO02245.1 L-proline dehydrogenase /delta-1-pyrroline-5-carboxylate dehydrogenase [Parasphingorhabdus marina DSM 22363]